MRDGKAYDIVLLHGSNQNQILTQGPVIDFDYSRFIDTVYSIESNII